MEPLMEVKEQKEEQEPSEEEEQEVEVKEEQEPQEPTEEPEPDLVPPGKVAASAAPFDGYWCSPGIDAAALAAYRAIAQFRNEMTHQCMRSLIIPR